MSGEVVLRGRGLSKTFGGVTVLEGADVELRAGETHAFLGENGAGKSTLAKILAGIHTPSAGTVEVNGQAVAFHGPRDAARHGIALIPQEPRVWPDLTVAENIFAGRLPERGGRVDWSELFARAAELFQTLGVGLDPRQPARGLSVADRQMMEMAGALAQEAKVLILDETTASLTPGEVARLFAILRRLRDAGTALAFIGHRMEEVFDLCDRATVLRDGKVVGERLIKETDVNDLLRLMVGREVDIYAERPLGNVGEPALEVRGLTLPPRFEDISFTVHRGEVVGLAGLVGAGRTDVACALFGLLKPVSSEVRVNGKPVVIRSPEDAQKLGMALVPEDRQRQGAFLPLSIWQNATLPALPRLSKFGWLDNGSARQTAQTWSERLSVRSRDVEQPLGELSGGNQQKVVLARWLETNPRILILDEPTRGIDVRAKGEIHRLIAELAEEGLAVLLISSDLPEVLSLSDRVIVLRAGRISAEFTRAEATPEAVIAAAGLGGTA